MKRFFLLLLILNLSNAYAQSELTLKVSHLIANGGCVNLAMYDQEKFYNDENIDQAYLVMKQRVISDTMTIVIPNLPFGYYAVQAFQDKDCTGRMKKGWFGIPKDAYGFSNNVRTPSYKKAVFLYDEHNIQQIITLEKYHVF